MIPLALLCHNSYMYVPIVKVLANVEKKECTCE